MILAFLESSRIDSWRSSWRRPTQSSWRRPLQAFEPLASQGCRSACPGPPDGEVYDEDDEDDEEVGDDNCDRDDGYLALPLQCEQVVLEGPVLLLVRFVLRNIWSLTALLVLNLLYPCHILSSARKQYCIVCMLILIVSLYLVDCPTQLICTWIFIFICAPWQS